MELGLDYLKTFGWGIVGAITMAVSLWILLKVFTSLTPVDEWEELKKGNLGIAIIHGCCGYRVFDCDRVYGGPSSRE